MNDPENDMMIAQIENMTFFYGNNSMHGLFSLIIILTNMRVIHFIYMGLFTGMILWKKMNLPLQDC